MTFLHKPRPDGVAQSWEISGLGQRHFPASQVSQPSLAQEGRACPAHGPKPGIVHHYGAGHLVTTTFVQWQNWVTDAKEHYHI